MNTVKIVTPVTSIVGLYDAVARAMGFNPEKCEYDCTKIKCASNFADEIEEAYKAKYPNDYKMAFGMHWVCYGPKVDEGLTDDTVIVEEGFFK